MKNHELLLYFLLSNLARCSSYLNQEKLGSEKKIVLLHQVNEPIPKIEGQSQCSGEAEYINDIPNFPGELSAYYVLASVGNCDLDTVDASAALVTFC